MLYPTQSVVGACLLASLAFAFQDGTEATGQDSTVPVVCANIIAALGDGIADDKMPVKGCEKAALR